MGAENREKIFDVVFFILISLIFISLLFLTPKFVGFMTAGVYINSPPSFNDSRPLPNITFTEDTIKKNAIDLNRSFFDPDNDEFIFKVFGNSSIIITINTTTKNVTFSANENFNGIEHIYFVGDDGHRRNATSNNITVNVTPVTDIFWAFQGTNFSALNLSNPFNLSLFNAFGKINFSVQVNFSANASKGQDINLTKYINISFNRIEVNSTHLQELNKSATLSLNDLTFSNPRILRNGEICPATICTKLSYSKGTLKFNVTSFTVYSSEETPSITAEVVGGGGGAGRAIIGPAFVIDKKEIKVKLKQGETKKEFLKIKNNLRRALTFILDLDSIKEFLKNSSVEEFTLSPKEEKLIELTFYAKPETKPGVYLENIIIRAEKAEKKIPVIMEVSSKEVFFDVALKIPEEQQKIALGQNIIPEITLFKLLEDVKGDVLVDIIVKDSKGNIILQKRRTVFIASTITFTEDIAIPKDAKPGTYILITKATYKGKTAVVSKTFEVVEEYTNLVFIFIMIVLVIISILLILLIIFMLKKAIKTREITQKSSDINELILVAEEYINLKDRRKALETYKKIKREFDKLPRVGKRKVWGKVKALAEKLKLSK